MKTDIPPLGATHWAPDTDEFNESWYKFDPDSNCWYHVCVDSYREFGSGWYGQGKRMLRDDLEVL
jgi:hypothetical protein